MESVNEQMKTNPEDGKYMARCIQLAYNGKGCVSPNPMVGAVIVYEGRVIGEGYHRCYGKAHAEVNAIRSVKDERLLAQSTLYVNLEPCSHYGKTPPCSKLIIEKKIPRVVVGTLDPFPEVAGRGVAMLRAAGVQVNVGILEEEALELNKRFFYFHKNRSPYIILKWAETADGFMDRRRTNPALPPLFISTPSSQRLVHKLRSEVDAIMVGRNTAYLDNPALTVRKWEGKNPVRVLVDRKLKISATSKLYDGSAPTLIFTETLPGETFPNVDFVQIDPDENGLSRVKTELYRRGIQSLLVEGGPLLLNEFIRQGVNEIRVETSNFCIGEGVPAPDLRHMPVKRTLQAGDSLIRYY